jgi:hypothetical protein
LATGDGLRRLLDGRDWMKAIAGEIGCLARNARYSVAVRVTKTWAENESLGCRSLVGSEQGGRRETIGGVGSTAAFAWKRQEAGTEIAMESKPTDVPIAALQ